jgi:hypothetical protein
MLSLVRRVDAAKASAQRQSVSGAVRSSFQAVR